MQDNNNARFQRVHKALTEIAYDPTETRARRNKAQAALLELTGPGTGGDSSLVGNHRGGAAIASDIDYDGASR